MNAASENQLANVEVAGVFSDSQDAMILKYAKSHNIFNAFLEPGEHKYKLLDEGENIWIKTIQELQPDLIVLAGFMRILGSKFLEGAARQPELVPMLQARMFLMLGLTDAVPIISIAFAALLMFANPFLGQVG